MSTIRFFGALLLGALLLASVRPDATARVPQSAALAPFTGYWTAKTYYGEMTLGFLPDGRYFFEFKAGDTPVYEKGRFRVAEGVVTFEPQGDSPTTFEFRMSGSTLVLAGPTFPEPVAFTKQAGSEKAIVDEVRAVDASKSTEDDTWRAKIPVGPKTEGPPPPQAVAIGDVMTDTNPRNTFPNATTFKSLEAYVQLGLPKEMVLRDGSRHTVFDSWKWYFYRHGRVFIRSAVFRENGPVEGNVTMAWGRYTITPGEGEEAVLVETDKGERIDLKLIDGRRNLLWGTDLYSNRKWSAVASPQ